MTRTPDEIKKGLETCSADECNGQHTDCPYHPDLMCIRNICADALALIQKLEAELEDMTARYKIADDCAKKKGEMNEKLYAELTAVKAERDAAVRDCGCFPCQTCEERENGDLCPMCEIQGGFRKFHQWRGVQKEN